MNKQIIAKIISRLFDPFVMLVGVFILLFWHTPLFYPSLFLMVIVPLALFIVIWKLKIIRDWDMRDRRQRPAVLWSLVATEAVAAVILKTAVTLPLIVGIMGFTLITHVWKISGHAFASALLAGLVIDRMGWWGYWPVLFVPIVISWARIVTRNHTLGQVVAGSLLGVTIGLLFV